jgi:hypothetical protein
MPGSATGQDNTTAIPNGSTQGADDAWLSYRQDNTTAIPNGSTLGADDAWLSYRARQHNSHTERQHSGS